MACDIFMNKIKDRFKFICYSPRLDRIVLLDGGKSSHVDSKCLHINFFYCYADEELFGKYMKDSILERDYFVYIGEV